MATVQSIGRPSSIAIFAAAVDAAVIGIRSPGCWYTFVRISKLPTPLPNQGASAKMRFVIAANASLSE